MTLEMIERARDNAQRGGYVNVEFRLARSRHCPLPMPASMWSLATA